MFLVPSPHPPGDFISITLIVNLSSQSFFSSLCLFLIKALHKALCELCPVEVLPDEDELVDPLLVGCPGLLRGSEIDLLVDSLEDELGVPLTVEAEETLGPVKVCGAVPEEVHHEHVEPLGVEVALERDSDALDERGVVGLLVGVVLIEEVRVYGEDGLHVEAVYLENFVEGGLGPFRLDDGCKLVDGLDSVLHPLLLLLIHQVQLVEEDLVGEGNLLEGLVDVPLGLDLVEVLRGG